MSKKRILADVKDPGFLVISGLGGLILGVIIAFIITVILAGCSPSGKPATLADMIKAGDYGLIHPGITAKRFPVKPELFTAVGVEVIEVFSPDRTMLTTTEVEAAIRGGGYEPATIEQLLAYGAKNPEEQRRYEICALGSPCVGPGGFRDVPYLYEVDGQRFLDLYWDYPGNRRVGRVRFLVVRRK